MPVFPSLEWFDALRRLVNADPRLRRLGSCDMRVGVQVDDVHIEIVFEAFECAAVRALSEAEAQTSCDFVLAMNGAQWRAMLDNIRAHHGADPRHTLNSLELPKVLHVRETADYSRRDKFYQYNQTLQFFFDTAAGLDAAERARPTSGREAS